MKSNNYKTKNLLLKILVRISTLGITQDLGIWIFKIFKNKLMIFVDVSLRHLNLKLIRIIWFSIEGYLLNG